jgi:hypothetical protein
MARCTTSKQTRDGGGKAALFCWSRQTVPACFLPTVSHPHTCLPAVCRARYASPTPARVEQHRPCEVKAAQEVGMMGVGALALALTRMVDLANAHGRQHHLFEVGFGCATIEETAYEEYRCEYIYNAKGKASEGSTGLGTDMEISSSCRYSTKARW